MLLSPRRRWTSGPRESGILLSCSGRLPCVCVKVRDQSERSGGLQRLSSSGLCRGRPGERGRMERVCRMGWWAGWSAPTPDSQAPHRFSSTKRKLDSIRHVLDEKSRRWGRPRHCRLQVDQPAVGRGQYMAAVQQDLGIAWEWTSCKTTTYVGQVSRD